MHFADLVAAADRVAATSGRKAKLDILADLLRRLAPAPEAPIAVALLSGTPRQGRIGIGAAAIRAARGGHTALDATISLLDVDSALAEIAVLAGPGSTGGKVDRLRRLLERCTGPEQHFLVRLLFGELRQGALEGLLAEAVARAAGVTPTGLRRAATVAGDLGPVAAAALERGEAGLAPFAVQLFRPIQPMLAQPAADLDDAFTRLPEALLETKLDGARIQVHRAGDEVRVYSRNLREVTPAVPEVVEAVRSLPAGELIADGEAIALRPDGSPHPFQITMRRFGRKRDVASHPDALRLSPFLFDLLHIDGQSLLDEPLSRRLAALSGVTPGSMRLASLRASNADPARAREFLADALRRGHEGVMAKSLAAPYVAGARGFSWLKIKSAHTLDLVVLAAEWGHGRRHGWLSNLHLGARDEERGGFVMLGKTFKGLTDAMLEWQTRKLLELEIGRDEWTVHVRPELVVEIACNDVQASPQYPGGLALRFARVKRFRDDKSAAQADTIERVRAIHLQSAGPAPP